MVPIIISGPDIPTSMKTQFFKRTEFQADMTSMTSAFPAVFLVPFLRSMVISETGVNQLYPILLT